MTELSNPERAALARIETMSDPDGLRNMITNAKRQGATQVEAAAFRRLCFVQPEANPNTVEHDVWQSIHALEEMMTEERGRTARLSRTRQKITRDGEAKTAADLTLRPQPSQGFYDLIERGHPELLFEAVVLRHPATFDAQTLEAAKTRLESVGVDIETITSTSSGGIANG